MPHFLASDEAKFITGVSSMSMVGQRGLTVVHGIASLRPRDEKEAHMRLEERGSSPGHGNWPGDRSRLVAEGEVAAVDLDEAAAEEQRALPVKALRFWPISATALR